MRLRRRLAILSAVRSWLVLLGVLVGCGDDGPTSQPPPGACLPDPAPATGEATYYDADGSGNCSFEPSSDLMVAAINGVDYDDAKWCGACLGVTGPSGEVTVRVVDQCPGCAKGDLDLLARSMEDFIVEPVRKSLIPSFDEVKKTSMEAGALGGGISGSGPSIFMLSDSLAAA